SAQVATDDSGHGGGRLPVREMPDGIEQYALIPPTKVCLEAFGQTRWITGRTPGLPLDACELDRIRLNVRCPAIGAQEPLVPEASCLIEGGNRKEASRLIRHPRRRAGTLAREATSSPGASERSLTDPPPAVR